MNESLAEHAERAANGSGEDFADWWERSLDESFRAWLQKAGYPDSPPDGFSEEHLKAAWRAGYEQRTDEE